MGWEERYSLDEDEVMSENNYTFERFRRKGVSRATAIQIREIMLQLGYRHRREYTDETNIAQLRNEEKSGNMVRERILERHFLFRVTRKILERYDPPIPVKAPQVN